MDLTLFIILLVFAILLYYLVIAIQSLILEMKEVKNKCIKLNNSNVEDFQVSTRDPAINFKETMENLTSVFKK